MAYDQTQPPVNTGINLTRLPIQTNFAAIKTLIDINHVTFDDPSGDQGKHKYITLPVQATAPPIAFGAGEVAAYSFLNATTAQNELYINKTNQATVTQIPATASLLSITSDPANDAQGWTYLPSGLLIKWGYGNVNGTGNWNYLAGPGAFTKIFNVLVTTSGSANNTATFISTTMTQMTINGSLRTNPASGQLTYFYYLAIGI